MQSTQTIKIGDILRRIENRYDPEHDTIPGAPAVTWADDELVEAIRRLVIIVEDLQDQIGTLQDRLSR